MNQYVSFAGGLVAGIVLACLSCAEAPTYSQPYSPPPPPHQEIASAMNSLQNARYTLINYAANDFAGHKRAAISYIDQALDQLQICMSMP